MILSISSCAYLPAICLFRWRVCSKLLPILLLGCLSAYYWVWEFFMYSEYKSLSDMWFLNIFSQSMSYIFMFLTMSFEEQKFLILMKHNISFLDCAFVLYLWKLSFIQDHKYFLLFICQRGEKDILGGRQRRNIFKVLEYYINWEYLSKAKANKDFFEHKDLKEFITSRSALWEMLKSFRQKGNNTSWKVGST